MAQNAVEWHSEIASEFDKKYKSSKGFMERYTLWTSFLDKYCKTGMKILDVGCGSGVFSFYLAEKGFEVTGLDASPEMLAICERKKSESGRDNVCFIQGDLEFLQESVGAEYDLVVCSSVLEYIPHLQASLAAVCSVLKPGGILLCSMPNARSLYRSLEKVTYALTGRPRYFGHVRNVLKLEAMKAVTEQCGLVPLEHVYYGCTPLLSDFFRLVGLRSLSDNLFLLVSRLELPDR